MKTCIPVVLAAAALAAGCSSPTSELSGLARQRLSLAPEVAWYKHNRNLPVYDPKRETEQLAAVLTESKAAGVPEETARHFFAAEMEVSRRVQWEWIHAWRKHSAPAPATPGRDLSTALRPQIDDINRSQIAALARGAKPPGIAQLTADSARFLPKN